MVGWVDFYRIWLLVDVWSIMFQTDNMKIQGAEYYLQALGLTGCPTITGSNKKLPSFFNVELYLAFMFLKF